MIYKSLKKQENQTRQARVFDDVQTRVCGFENSPKTRVNPGFIPYLLGNTFPESQGIQEKSTPPSKQYYAPFYHRIILTSQIEDKLKTLDSIFFVN